MHITLQAPAKVSQTPPKHELTSTLRLPFPLSQRYVGRDVEEDSIITSGIGQQPELVFSLLETLIG